MDNIHADHELDAKTLRRAVNADVLDSGKIRRRKGFSPFLAEPGAHSLWASSSGAAFFVSGQTLWRLFADGTKEAIATLAPNSGPLCYLEVNGRAYFNSAASRGRIDDGLAVVPWGVDVPVSPPLMVQGPGALDAGTYHAVITYVLADGRESGASVSSSITHTSPGSNDYALQSMVAGGFGLVTEDEAHTLLAVIRNLQVRVAEVESKLFASGLLA